MMLISLYVRFSSFAILYKANATIAKIILIILKSATNSDVDYILQFASPSDDCLATADVIMYG